LRTRSAGNRAVAHPTRLSIPDHPHSYQTLEEVEILALLSTADGRPLALLRQFVAVMIRGFIEHLYKRSDRRAGTLRLARALVAALARQIKQMGLIPAGPKSYGGKWPRLRRQRG